MKFQNHRKWLFFLFITLFSLWFSGYVQREIRIFHESSARDFFDFNVYYTGGLVARSDTDKRLYSYKEIQDPNQPSEKVVVNPQLQSPEPDSTFGYFAKQTGADGQYLYPPFFSMTIVPLTYLSFEKAKILWHVFIFLLAGAAVFLTVRLLYEDYLTIALIAGVAVMMMEFTLPMQDLLFGSNITSIILFFSVAGLCLHKKYPTFGALFFALAVIIKLTPIVIVPLMVVRKQWKWLIAFCCWSVLLWGLSIWQLGWQNHREFVTQVMPAMSSGIPHPDNRSLSTVIYAVSLGKFLTYDEIRQGEYIFPPRTPILLFKMLALVTFLGLLIFFWYTNKSNSQLHIEVLLLLLWSIIFSPVGLRYSYLLAVSPIVFAWLHPLTKKASSMRLLLLSIATFTIFSVLPSYGLVVTDSFPIHLVLVSVMPIGVILCMWHLITLLKSVDEIPPAY